MTTHTIKHDRTTQVNINTANDTWTLDKNAELNVIGKPAMSVGQNAHDNTININGDLINSGYNSFGIFVGGNHNTINFGSDSHIVAATAIVGDVTATNTIVTNKGDIDANTYGVFINATAHVINSGNITGFAGVVVGHDVQKFAKMTDDVTETAFENLVVNKEGGEIWGGQSGVFFQGDGNHKFVNDGFVSGFGSAVSNEFGSLHIVNRGRIDGIIQFGEGDDVLDNRQGVVHGEIWGGDGNDTFMISSKSTKITELTDGGYDIVKTSVNYTMAANLDRLEMLGKSNLVVHGNELGNVMQGNSGDNTLYGEGGGDQLGGGDGTDTLYSGDGFDTFIFNKGTGVDTAMDFDNAKDTLSLSGFSGVNTFADVSSHISAHGSDVWISFGSDKLVLHDTALSEMDAADFTFPL